MPLIIVAAAVLVNHRGEILLARRGQDKTLSGMWELPGGKVEANETPEMALIRELDEELAIVIKQADLKSFSFASYPYNDWHLLMPVFICRSWTGDVIARTHDMLKWVLPEHLNNYSVLTADLALIDLIAKGGLEIFN